LEKFLIWMRQEIELYYRYKRIPVNLEILPQKLSIDTIDSIKSDIQFAFSIKFYKKNLTENCYELDKTIPMNSIEYDSLCSSFVFIRGRIVSVNYGYYVGGEINGIHPSLILGKAENGELFVIPISDGEGSDRCPYYKVIQIYDSPTKSCGIANIDELRRISKHRIETTHESSKVDTDTLFEVIEKTSSYFGNLYKFR